MIYGSTKEGDGDRTRLTFLKSPSPKLGLNASFNSERGRLTELGIDPSDTSSGSLTSTIKTS